MAAIVLTSGTVLVISVITGSASPVDSSLHQCVINENITKFPHPGLDCCQNKDHWIVEGMMSLRLKLHRVNCIENISFLVFPWYGLGDVPLQIKLLTTTKELAVTSKFWKMFDNCLLIEIVCRCVADFLCLSNNETGGEEGWSGCAHYNIVIGLCWQPGSGASARYSSQTACVGRSDRDSTSAQTAMEPATVRRQVLGRPLLHSDLSPP